MSVIRLVQGNVVSTYSHFLDSVKFAQLNSSTHCLKHISYPTSPCVVDLAEGSQLGQI